MQHILPNIGLQFTKSTLDSFFKKQNIYISFLAESVGDDPQNPKIVEISEELSERSKIEPWQWKIALVKDLKNEEGKVFSGSCFYNKAPLSVTWKFSDKKATLYGFCIYANSVCDSSEFGIYGTFAEPIELNTPVPKTINIPVNMLIGYFGRGDYTPKLEEIMKNEEKDDVVLGCPLANPKNCKFNGNEKFCAFAKEDNVCLKAVSLKVTAQNSSGGAA